jgi:hypothetical protein
MSIGQSLLNLNKDCTLNVIDHLNHKEIFTFREVCKKVKELIENNADYIPTLWARFGQLTLPGRNGELGLVNKAFVECIDMEKLSKWEDIRVLTAFRDQGLDENLKRLLPPETENVRDQFKQGKERAEKIYRQLYSELIAFVRLQNNFPGAAQVNLDDPLELPCMNDEKFAQWQVAQSQQKT